MEITDRRFFSDQLWQAGMVQLGCGSTGHVRYVLDLTLFGQGSALSFNLGLPGNSVCNYTLF